MSEIGLQLTTYVVCRRRRCVSLVVQVGLQRATRPKESFIDVNSEALRRLCVGLVGACPVFRSHLTQVDLAYG